MLYQGFKEHTDLRDIFGPLRELDAIKEVVRQLKERRKDKTGAEKLGWYKRYWSRNFVDIHAETNEEDVVVKKVCL